MICGEEVSIRLDGVDDEMNEVVIWRPVAQIQAERSWGVSRSILTKIAISNSTAVTKIYSERAFRKVRQAVRGVGFFIQRE